MSQQNKILRWVPHLKNNREECINSTIFNTGKLKSYDIDVNAPCTRYSCSCSAPKKIFILLPFSTTSRINFPLFHPRFAIIVFHSYLNLKLDKDDETDLLNIRSGSNSFIGTPMQYVYQKIAYITFLMFLQQFFSSFFAFPLSCVSHIVISLFGSLKLY